MKQEDITLEQAEKYFGFIYKITNTKTGQFYIGKKNFKTSTTIKLTLEQRKELNTRKHSIIKIKESDWRNYYGSCVGLTEDIKALGEESFEREVLCLCMTQRDLTYQEVKHQFQYNVLEDKNSYNLNILGKFWKGGI